MKPEETPYIVYHRAERGTTNLQRICSLLQRLACTMIQQNKLF